MDLESVYSQFQELYSWLLQCMYHQSPLLDYTHWQITMFAYLLSLQKGLLCFTKNSPSTGATLVCTFCKLCLPVYRASIPLPLAHCLDGDSQAFTPSLHRVLVMVTMTSIWQVNGHFSAFIWLWLSAALSPALTPAFTTLCLWPPDFPLTSPAASPQLPCSNTPSSTKPQDLILALLFLYSQISH